VSVRRRLFGRVLATLPLLLGVAALTFLLVESAPGVPGDVLLGDRPLPPEVRERLERAYGLDRAPGERFALWLMALARGELGWSWSRSMPVGRALAAALPATLLRSGAALLIHVLAGVAIGVTAAARRGRLPDRILTLSTLALWSMPTFWVGLMAILALAYGLPVFPPSSMRSVGAAQLSLPARALDVLWHLCLPAFVLGISSAAATARFIRAGLVQTLDEEFVRAARARGLGGRRVLLVHALRNALLPVINVLGLSLPILVSGSLVVEVVFAWPGMGRLTYDAILAQDVPLVLATTLLASVMVIAGSLLADLAMAAVDPRIRVAPRGAGS
jgi:peptide/nickel transport system permease protein